MIWIWAVEKLLNRDHSGSEMDYPNGTNVMVFLEQYQTNLQKE